MILGDPARATAPPQGDGRVTIDGVFRRLAQRRPDALALADPPNRATFTDGAPRRLTYAEADRVVTAIAGRLRRMALPPDAIVGIQLPNTAENILTMLGALRAGMIIAPLPLLWRHADAVAALARIGAKALITCGRVGAFHHCELAMRVAAEVFSIRYVGAFGKNLPDGVVPFDDLFDAENSDPDPALDHERQSNATAHVAAITFDVGASGIVPVARNHAELFAGGLGVLLESRLPPDSHILSTVSPSSFAGISLTLLPWLLSGGALVLHQPFDPEVLVRQRRDDRCGALIVPGPVACQLAETGVFADQGATCAIATWLSPERLAASQAWREPNATLVDVSAFGEVAIVPARRGPAGRPSLIPFGSVMAPRESEHAAVIAELARTEAGTVALRGPMVPQHAFPPGAERSDQPHFKIGPGGWVDSGYACRVDYATKAMVVTGRPAGIVNIGGYRFPLRALQDAVRRINSGATLVSLPYPFIGQRLIGNAGDRNAMMAALGAAGLNPLVVAAFGGRRQRDRADTPASAA
jgi:acyl-CoA synthetase (AMP-forming)/AMP-acid ligase II